MSATSIDNERRARRRQPARRAIVGGKRAVRAGVDCIYHCDLADEEALDMLEATKDLSILVGPRHFSMIMKDGAMYRDPRSRRTENARRIAAA